MLSFITTVVASEALCKVNGVSVPWTDLPVVVLSVVVKVVSGWVIVPNCNCKTSNCLFSVAVTVAPPTSPVALAVPLVVIS